MDDDRQAGAGRAVERQAEDIARRNRGDDLRTAFARQDPARPAKRDDRNAPDEEEDDDRGPTPV